MYMALGPPGAPALLLLLLLLVCAAWAAALPLPPPPHTCASASCASCASSSSPFRPPARPPSTPLGQAALRLGRHELGLWEGMGMGRAQDREEEAAACATATSHTTAPPAGPHVVVVEGLGGVHNGGVQQAAGVDGRLQLRHGAADPARLRGGRGGWGEGSSVGQRGAASQCQLQKVPASCCLPNTQCPAALVRTWPALPSLRLHSKSHTTICGEEEQGHTDEQSSCVH